MNTRNRSIISAAAGMLLGTSAMATVAFAAATQPSVLVMGQTPKNGSVSVTYAYLPKDGIIAIHPTDASGKMSANSIGHIALSSGDHRDVQVKLDESVKPGTKLWAALQENTGSQGNAKAEQLFTAFGKPVEQSFKIR